MEKASYSIEGASTFNGMRGEMLAKPGSLSALGDKSLEECLSYEVRAMCT